MEISLESVELHADTTQHTAKPLNRLDALSRKVGLRLGNDSAGVGVKNLLGEAVV